MRIFFFAALIAAGFWLRYTQWPGWQLWRTTPIVTLYFDKGPFFFPVSHRVPAGHDLPRAALQALTRDRGFNDVQLRGVTVQDGMAHVDLSAAPTPEGQASIVETLTALGNVSSVEIRVGGTPIAPPEKHTPLLYFASPNGLVAIPAAAAEPRQALAMYLAGPPRTSDWMGLPEDVRLLEHEYNSADGLLSLKFSYTSSLRALAIERPDRMRTILLGLIATVTEFPEVHAVQLDFGGQTRLGFGQCSDLLRTPQRRPTLLNDERLL